MGRIKVTYRKKDTVPIVLSAIPALLGADTTIYEATVEVGGRKYRGTGTTKEKALQEAMSRAGKH